MDIDWIALEHPDDSRVIVTDNVDVFKAVATNSAYQAAILERSKNIIDPLREQFRTSFFEGYLKKDGVDCLTIPVSAYDLECSLMSEISSYPDIIRRELITFASVFNEMSGDRICAVAVAKNIRAVRGDVDGMHAHDQSLSCTWFAAGTFWKNMQGARLQAPEGAYFYFKDDFWHGSPREETRLTILAL